MNKSKLARDLGISRTMVFKLEKKGMPTDSLEAALTWRSSLLSVQTKDFRIDGNPGTRRKSPQVSNSDELNKALHNVDIDAELDQLNGNI